METRIERLLSKANTLPLTPGVYIMKDKAGKVIYVGKSRKLKNRVSQYFQNSEKNLKTMKMVSLVHDFDYYLCDTEIEALTLENRMIKQYSPKYNIRLKDSKSYPYIKVTAGEYPQIVYTRKRTADKGARYFGPYSGTGTVFSVINLLQKSLGIPSCKRSFPKDIGKERPCIYYQMGQCLGVCTGKVSSEEYGETIKCAVSILRGNTSEAKKELTEQMLRYAEEEKFEVAARCRDAIAALESLSQKQKVVAAPDADKDVFALYSDDNCSVISVFNIREGAVTDKMEFYFGADQIADETTMPSFIGDYYLKREYVPHEILLDFNIDEEDSEILSGYLAEMAGRRVEIRTPERGDMRTLCRMVYANAKDKAKLYKLNAEKDESTLILLASMLGLEVLPERIEAYDISNLGSEHKTCGMVVCREGKFRRSDYRSFTIKTVEGVDDYASMREALRRRLSHLSDDSGSFSERPDLILLDGGKGHVSTVRSLMREMGIDIPTFGMVKDDFHKTRALCDEESEISIAREQSVFSLIYRIQEEVHRYSVSRMDGAKRKTLTTSSLEKINGIGKAKAKALLTYFGGLAGVRNASREELSSVGGIGQRDADNIYEYFHGNND
ncbi:MAG: excinuclease ABC subunit UvrC [Clostridia bacterium]|nr:excinuclease ABC subunit UvrC [Clostridia bacterium]